VLINCVFVCSLYKCLFSVYQQSLEKYLHACICLLCKEYLRWVVGGSEVKSVTSSTQNPSSLALVQSVLNNEALGTESQPYNCSIVRRGNAAEHACPEVKRWQPHHQRS